MMGLDIYFAEDICNAILAADEASADMAAVAVGVGADVRKLRAYRQGFRAALATVALALGVMPLVTGAAPPASIAVTKLQSGEDVV